MVASCPTSPSVLVSRRRRIVTQYYGLRSGHTSARTSTCSRELDRSTVWPRRLHARNHANRRGFVSEPQPAGVQWQDFLTHPSGSDPLSPLKRVGQNRPALLPSPQWQFTRPSVTLLAARRTPSPSRLRENMLTRLESLRSASCGFHEPAPYDLQDSILDTPSRRSSAGNTPNNRALGAPLSISAPSEAGTGLHHEGIAWHGTRVTPQSRAPGQHSGRLSPCSAFQDTQLQATSTPFRPVNKALPDISLGSALTESSTNPGYIGSDDSLKIEQVISHAPSSITELLSDSVISSFEQSKPAQTNEDENEKRPPQEDALSNRSPANVNVLDCQVHHENLPLATLSSPCREQEPSIDGPGSGTSNRREAPVVGDPSPKWPEIRVTLRRVLRRKGRLVAVSGLDPMRIWMHIHDQPLAPEADGEAPDILLLASS